MRRLLSLLNVRRRQREHDLQRELQHHLDLRTDELMRGGMEPSEARRRAAIEFGGLSQIQEDVRDIWLTRWLRDFLGDVRFSARSLLREPSFAATVLLSLALGIGSTTAIYSLLDQVALRPLPVREPERLVLVDWNGYPASINAFGATNLVSYPLCRDLQQQTAFFDGVLCRAPTPITLSTGGEPQTVAAEIVSGSYFSVLGLRPALGRLFADADDQTPGASPVVVVSHDFWKTQLAGAADISGRVVLINKHPMTIVGVAPEGFRGIDVGEVPSLWIPAVMSSQAIPGFDQMISRRVRWMQVLCRLRPDITLARAQAGLDPWFKAMLQEDIRQADFPSVSADRRQRFLESSLELAPAPQGYSPMRRKLSQPLWVLFVGTAVLLGLSCLNVAGLFLPRGSARSREIVTRLALGASRGRIGRQLVADSAAIAFVGGLIGVAFAPFAMRALIAILPRDVAATAVHASIDTRVLLFALAISIVAGLVTGIAPAWQAGRRSLMGGLRERTAAALGGLRVRRVIVTVQIALTLILVTAAALFVRTLISLTDKGPGFDTSRLIGFGISPLRNGSSQPEAARLVRRVLDDLHTSPAIQTAATFMVPLLNGGTWNGPLTIQGDQRFTTDREVHLNFVSAEFFGTLGVKLLAGRDFDQRESFPASGEMAHVAIVNEAFAKRYFPGRSPLGAHLGQGTGPNIKTDTEIVGVVANISYRGMREDWEQAYFPLIGAEGGNYYVRAAGNPDDAIETIRSIVRGVDPTLPFLYVRTLDEQINRSLNTERMLAALSTGYAVLGLLLALVGLYGVTSFAVVQRTREIGIRMALGGTRAAVAWLVLGDALLMISAGIAIGLPILWALSRYIASEMYGVTPTDPLTIAGAAVILGLVTLGSSLVPAQRASTVDPVQALRCE